MKPHRQHILFVSQDAGGFQAIIPVYRRLKKRKTVAVSGIFGDVARALPTSRGLKLVSPERYTDAEMQSVFDRVQPQLVVTGPSGSGTSLDKRAIALAQRRSIPTMTVADNCMNVPLLFGRQGDARMIFLPESICVMNAFCAAEMKKNGVPESSITITGNPYFDSISMALGRATSKKRIALFICQPFSELIAAHAEAGYGYTEQVVFADVVSALNRIDAFDEIIVRWHPRTQLRQKFDHIIKQSLHPVTLDAKTPLPKLIRKATIVIGMNSTALMDAALAGRSVVSYQPGLNRGDALMTNTWGLSSLVTKKEQLLATIRRAIIKKPSKKRLEIRKKVLPSGATNRVIHIINEMLNV
jgi:hypothetical protein